MSTPKPRTKYDACRAFNDGVIFCLFRRGFCLDDDAVWMAGYTYGASIKPSMYAACNLALVANGYDEIAVMNTCGE